MCDFDVDYDVDMLDMDDDWIYVEDGFTLPDELAEGQVASPGYSGTRFEIDSDAYEFDLYHYWEDLEYADDSYWDYGLSRMVEASVKRKHDGSVVDSSPKRRRRTVQTFTNDSESRDSQPLLFHDRDERIRNALLPAPVLEDRAKFAFLPDWKERFAKVDGSITRKQMPVEMRKAAKTQFDAMLFPHEVFEGHADTEDDNDEADWEDDEEEGGAVRMDVDPEMLKVVLRRRLEEAGLAGLDENAFLVSIQEMMSGGAGDNATAGLATDLLGKLTTDEEGEALSGWLSHQGVTLSGNDSGPSVAEGDTSESNSTFNEPTYQSPLKDGPMAAASQIAHHSEARSRKRASLAEDDVASKKQKQRQAEAAPSRSSVAPRLGPRDSMENITSGSVLQSGSTRREARCNNMPQNNGEARETIAVEETFPQQTKDNTAAFNDSRKRKASLAEDAPLQSKFAQRKTRGSDLQAPEVSPDDLMPDVPTTRTRGVKDRSGRGH